MKKLKIYENNMKKLKIYENNDEEIQQYVDIISMNPNNPSYQKYKDILKSKFDIDYDKLDKDNQYIDSANIFNILSKSDFLNFDNYVKYAKKIFQLRGLIDKQPKHYEGLVSIEKAKEICDKLNCKIEYREYNGNGNIAGHNLIDTIIMPKEIDVNTFIHELGHHFDHYYSRDYQGLAKTITYASSPYEIGKSNEVFAENFMHYFIAPIFLKDNLFDVYNELNNKIPSDYKNYIYKLL